MADRRGGLLGRRSIRLLDHDYTTPGAYFLTICTYRRALLFENAECAGVVHREWLRSAELRPEIELDAFVVMPNHIHGIAWLRAGVDLAETSSPTRFRRLPARSISAFVRAYKAAVTREINVLRGRPGATVWQRNYYEHIVRTEQDLDRIRAYIAENPRRWAFDRENPRGRTDRAEREFWDAMT